MRVSVSTAALLLLAACTQPITRESAPPSALSGFLTGATFIDLSHAYDENALYWPTAEGFSLRKDADGITPGGYYYAANSFFTSEHGGTHIDAPVHFAQGRQSVDQIPLDSLIAPLVVVDVSDAAAADRDHQVSQADFERFERQHGVIPDGSIVLIRTGYASRWPDAEAYLGTAERGATAVAKLHFPGLHPDAAAWVATNRTIKAIGIDTASIDYGQSTLFETHRQLFERNIPALENIASLDGVPMTGAWLLALPMKVGGGSGAPLRAVAVVPAVAR